MTRGRAKLAMSQGISVWVLEAPQGFGDAGFHSHHAIQITCCLSGALALGTDTVHLSGPVVAVAADARHRLEGAGLFVFIFVEPESRTGRALSTSVFRGRELITIDDSRLVEQLASLRETFGSSLPSSALVEAGQAAVSALLPQAEGSEPDARIQRIIDYSAAHLDQPLNLAAAAQGIYLSPSRLRHLFVEQTGLAFKTYVLWLRLVRAVTLYADGASLTEAAHEAGFSDSAHFSKVFKRTFGLPATTLTRL